jgi:hypothetical protein
MPIYKLVVAIMLLSASSVFADAIENINTANGEKLNTQHNTEAPAAIIGTKKPVPSFSKGLFGDQKPRPDAAGDKSNLTKTLAELPTTSAAIGDDGLSSNCQIRFLLGLNNVPKKGRISGFLLGAGNDSSSTMTLSPIIMFQNLRVGIPLSFETDKPCWRMFVPQSFSIETALQKKLKAATHNKRLLYILRHK